MAIDDRRYKEKFNLNQIIMKILYIKVYGHPYNGLSNKKEVPTQVVSWMKLKSVTWSEKSQIQEDHILHDSSYMKCSEKD